MRCQLKVALVILTALICPAVSFATVSVSISPSTVQVQPGGQAQFNAVVSGTNSVVVWSLTGVNCSGVACGQISSTGLYLAPTTAPNPNVVTVTATVLSDLSVAASAARLSELLLTLRLRPLPPRLLSLLVNSSNLFHS